MNGIEIITLFVAIPAVTLIAFILCLCFYLREKKKSDDNTDEQHREKLKDLKTACLVTGIITGIFVSALILMGIMALMIITSM